MKKLALAVLLIGLALTSQAQKVELWVGVRASATGSKGLIANQYQTTNFEPQGTIALTSKEGWSFSAGYGFAKDLYVAETFEYDLNVSTLAVRFRKDLPVGKSTAITPFLGLNFKGYNFPESTNADKYSTTVFGIGTQLNHYFTPGFGLSFEVEYEDLGGALGELVNEPDFANNALLAAGSAANVLLYEPTGFKMSFGLIFVLGGVNHVWGDDDL